MQTSEFFMRTGLILYQADLTLIAIITILVKILITVNMIYLKRDREVHPSNCFLTINSVLIQIQNDISIKISLYTV